MIVTPKDLNAEKSYMADNARFGDLMPDDLPAASVLEEKLFSSPWSLEALKDAVSRKDSVYAACYLNDALAGYCGLYLIEEEGYINQVAVAEQFQGMGLGRKMLAYLMDEAASRGMTACTLEVRVSNERAVRLYHSLGFEDAGIRPGFYDKPKEDALIMWRKNEVF